MRITINLSARDKAALDAYLDDEERRTADRPSYASGARALLRQRLRALEFLDDDTETGGADE